MQRAMATLCRPCPLFVKRCLSPMTKNPIHSPHMTRCTPRCAYGLIIQPVTGILHQVINSSEQLSSLITNNSAIGTLEASRALEELRQNIMLLDLDPATAKLAIPFIGPFLSAFSFLFIIRIVMSWYPKLPVGKFPYILAYAPTEPILVPTRKVIPPLGGVDVTPVVWFGLLSFLNEILVGPQGLLVLLSQQV